MDNEIDLVELELHLESLRQYAEKNLPDDIKEKLLLEIQHLETIIRNNQDES